MNQEGYKEFTMHNHTKLWKEMDAKNSKYNYGIMIVNQWYWYENWIEEVKRYCEKEKKSK